LIGIDEIDERSEEVIDLEAGENFGEILDTGSDVINFLHNGTQSACSSVFR